jgi:AcrR family transcriptional regulator
MAIARGNRKAQLLREAMKLFSQQGYDKVTVKQLGDICGITEPAVYRHYASKQALYDAVLNSVDSRLDPDALAVKLESEKDVRRLLQKFGAGLTDIYARNKDICRLLLYSALKNPGKGKKVYNVIRGKYEVLLTGQLQRLHRGRAIGKRNFAVTAQSFVGLVFDCSIGQNLWRKTKGRSFKPREVLKDAIPMFVKALGK